MARNHVPSGSGSRLTLTEAHALAFALLSDEAVMPGIVPPALYVRDLRNPEHARYEPDHWSCSACNELGRCQLTQAADKIKQLCGACKPGGRGNLRFSDPAVVASWVCRSDNGCGYWLVCAQCYTEHYWGLDPF